MFAATLALGCSAPSQPGRTPAAAASCQDRLEAFTRDLWQPIFQPRCLSCHRRDGVAAAMGARLRLADASVPGALAANHDALARYAASAGSTLLQKPSGRVHHYGGAQLPVGSPGYARLAAFVAAAPPPIGARGCSFDGPEQVAAGAEWSTAPQLVRRAALALAGRPPTIEEAERAAGGEAALRAVVADLVGSDGFARRLARTYNDLLLTDALIGTGQGVFLAMRGNSRPSWFGGPSAWPTTAAWQNAIDESNVAIAREAVFQVAYLARHGLPFTQVLTADHTVLNPYGACLLGVAGQMQFRAPVACRPGDVYDPWDLAPVRLHAHHAGVLTTTAFLARHTNTVTNRNRNRANTVTQAFLGTDLLRLSSIGINTANLQGINPPLTVPVCTVCHRIMDPIAGTFQNWDPLGAYVPNPWYTDQAAPGFAGRVLPDDRTAEALPWLAEQVAGDPRFPRQVAQVVFTAVTGSPPPELAPPGSPAWQPAWRAWITWTQAVDRWAEAFVRSGYDVRALATDVVMSPYYRVSALPRGLPEAERTTLASFSHRPLATPEALDERVEALLFAPWTNETGRRYLATWLSPLYEPAGGIDFNQGSRRPDRLDGEMAAVRLRMANEMACRVAARAFSGDASQAAQAMRRHLFGGLAAGDHDPARVRAAIASMRSWLLGSDAHPDDAAVLADHALFRDVLGALPAGDRTLPKGCWATHELNGKPLPRGAQRRDDPHHSVQAWTAVLSTVLADPQWLVE